MPAKKIASQAQATNLSLAAKAAVTELEEFKEEISRKRKDLDDPALVGELSRYWEAWRGKHGAIEVAVFAWSHQKGLEFRGGDLGALRAFARLTLDLDRRRASEFAKLMDMVITKWTPGEAAASIQDEGGARELARRIHTRDDPKNKKVAKRIKAAKQPLKGERMFVEKGGNLLPARAKRDASSFCQSALIYDDLRRLLRLKVAGKSKALAVADQKQLDALIDRWNDIDCPKTPCPKQLCPFAGRPKWLPSSRYANLYDFVDDLGEQRLSAARSGSA